MQTYRCVCVILAIAVTAGSSVTPVSTQALYSCSPFGYSNATAFKINLDFVLASLGKSISATGFGTASQGQDTDPVYGLAQCTNDLPKNECLGCFEETEKQIQKLCADKNGGRIYLNGCFLRYENTSFAAQVVDNSVSKVCNASENSTQPNQFSETAQKLLTLFSSEAPSSKGFAVESIRVGSSKSSTRIYGLAQCWRSLTNIDCQGCIEEARNLIQQCLPMTEGQALQAGCYLHYANYPFFYSLENPSNGGGSKTKAKIAGMLIGSIGGAVLILTLCLLFLFRRHYNIRNILIICKRSYTRDDTELAAVDESALVNFDYEVLRVASKNFDSKHKIGEGGFGQVFKGILWDGREVAVKKLFVSQSNQALAEFLTEIKLIRGLRHRNLVRLLGCCIKGDERFLVYEFMANRSLDKHLFGGKGIRLSWETRLEIIIGTARGLAYLHNYSHLRIVHRDIKAANILLDDNLHPKIADFGLAKLFPDDQTHLTTRVGGTIGYTAPEYVVHGQLTEKVDVYSYGVVVLEIVSGRKIMDTSLPSHMQLLLEWAWKSYKRHESLDIVDIKLKETYNRAQILRAIHVGLLCTQATPTLRPSMSNIESMLTSETEILEEPTQPAFIDMGLRGLSWNIVTSESALLGAASSSQSNV